MWSADVTVVVGYVGTTVEPLDWTLESLYGAHEACWAVWFCVGMILTAVCLAVKPYIGICVEVSVASVLTLGSCEAGVDGTAWTAVWLCGELVFRVE